MSINASYSLLFSALMFLISIDLVNAETVGQYAKALPSSEQLSVIFTDDDSSHPYCSGKKEVVSFTYSNGESFPLARGCWTVSENKKYISVDMYAYSDGREISFPVNIEDVEQKSNYMTRLISSNPAEGKSEEIFNAMQSVRDDVSIYYAGACDLMIHIKSNVKNKEQEAVLMDVRHALSKATDTEDSLLDDYCAAKSRIYWNTPRP